ncbi:hypothetical protein CPC08DRAFT_341092 [Agrocybe pediades]|nr:hypothetical protein CPC08DRAFT_341092 [Agrocybe pediades]
MHQALLIDEIFREIASFTLEYGRKSLICAARTCRAWKDPALDFIWERLPSVEPLLVLLPGVSLSNGEYICNNLNSSNLNTFNSYAERVKHIRNTQNIKLHSNLASIMPCSYSQHLSIPNLLTSYISIPRCNERLIHFNFSASLQCVDMDLGFKAQRFDVEESIAKYMEQLKDECHQLRHIGLRGTASPRINDTIAAMSNLESASLRLGNSLLPGTLARIAMFPSLQELEVHAGHIQCNDIDETLGKESSLTFPSLRKLHIRAKSSVVEKITEMVQPDTLQHFHIELDDPAPSDSHWDVIFESISMKAATSLRHLALEHQFELPEQSLPTQAVDPSSIAPGVYTPPSSMQFDSLKKLRGLSQLRHFRCDLTLPPTSCEQGLPSLLAWWPLLSHLNLGSAPDTDDNQYPVTAKLTPASLSFLSKKSVNLETLILPFVLDDLSLPPTEEDRAQNRILNMTVSRLESVNAQQFAERIHSLFPALQNLEGAGDESPTWAVVKKVLHDTHLSTP